MKRVLLAGLVSAALSGAAMRAWIAFINRPVEVPFWIRYEGKIMEGVEFMSRADARLAAVHRLPPTDGTVWVPNRE